LVPLVLLVLERLDLLVPRVLRVQQGILALLEQLGQQEPPARTVQLLVPLVQLVQLGRPELLAQREQQERRVPPALLVLLALKGM
jgi:hypothetical protein